MKIARRRAFTLIELLATIGIVMVLAAVCLTSLGKLRTRTYEVQDVNSLRQLGIAYNLMMNDLTEVRPNDFFDPNDKLWAYTSDTANESASWDKRISQTAFAKKLLSSAYWTRLNSKYTGGEQYPRSYSVNASPSLFLQPPPDSGQPDWERLSVPTTRILSQPRVVLLFMTYANGTPGIAWMSAANPIYSGINKTGYGEQFGRTPILFIDGSAQIADLAREYNDNKTWGL